MTTMEVVMVGKDHPIWTSFDDDDWGGATASMWILSFCKGRSVKLYPAENCDASLVERIRDAIKSVADSVEVHKPAPVL